MQPRCFDDKVKHAIELIRLEAQPGQAVVMSSFGKDSMVLLDLVEKAGFKFPVVSFREPYHREKYDFADRVIRSKELVVYDYPPLGTGLVKKDDRFEVMNFHQVGGPDEYIVLPTGIIPPQGGRWLCVWDILDKPLGMFAFPWQQVLIGHKASDVDPMWGEVGIADEKREAAGKLFLYPLMHFTDEDVWQYHRRYELPIHVERYDPVTGKEWPDKRLNPDYFSCCTACVDKDLPDVVYCPKFSAMITNRWRETNYLDASLPSYIGRKNDGSH